MKRSEFREFISSSISKGKKSIENHVLSDCDPTFAQTGRQMIVNPLPIEYRMKYPQGVPLDKNNPFNFAEYDKIYPDTFKAMREARAKINDTKTHLNEIKQDLEIQNNQQ